MKLVTATREVTSHGVLQTARATIANSAKVFSLFETQIYSDNFRAIVRAIVRELVANAIDSHRMADNPDQVHVYLPDEFDPYFRVKDQGLGMSHEFCMNDFMRYSDGSTKDHSDEAIGGFGAGSKSAFSYTDQFTLRAVHNGVLSIYTVFKDEDGIPSIALLDQSQTDEVNGVEFQVPVEPDDFHKFVAAAQTHLPYFLPEIQLHGTTIDPVHYVQRGAKWGVRPRDQSNKPQVVMGGMAYPIDPYQLDYKLRYDNRLSPLLNMPIDLYLPIGACTVPLSREGLLYDAKTKAAIAAILAEIIDEITADLPTMFDGQPSLWMACQALSDYLGGDEHNARTRLVLAHVQYKGQKLGTSFKVSHQGPFTYWSIEPRGQRRRRAYAPTTCPNPSWNGAWGTYFKPSDYAQIIIDDLEPHQSPVKRIKTFVDDDLELTDRVLVLRTGEGDLQALLEAFGNPQDYILTSSLPEPAKVSRASQGKMVRPRVRMFKMQTTYIDYHQSTISPRQWRSPVEEITYANQPVSGILVVMDNFTLPRDFWRKYDAGLIDAGEIHLVNKGDAPKLTSFEAFNDVFEQRLKAKLALYPTLPQWRALQYSEVKDLVRFIRSNPELFTNVSKSRPLGRLVELVKTYAVDAPATLDPHITQSLPPRVDTKKLRDQIADKDWKFLTLFNTVNRNLIDPETALFKLFKEVI